MTIFREKVLHCVWASDRKGRYVTARDIAAQMGVPVICARSALQWLSTERDYVTITGVYNNELTYGYRAEE